MTDRSFAKREEEDEKRRKKKEERERERGCVIEEKKKKKKPLMHVDTIFLDHPYIPFYIFSHSHECRNKINFKFMILIFQILIHKVPDSNGTRSTKVVAWDSGEA